jgi:hypothetical protein
MDNYILGAVIFVSLSLGAYGEHQRLTALHDAQIARLAKARAEEVATYTESLVVAARASDEALTEWRSKTKSAEETRDATKKKLAEVTSRTRACLSGDAARLLNNPSALPNAAQHPAGSPPAVTPDPAGFASEHAVAEWAADVSRLYNQCRAQIEGLAKWRKENT